MSSPPHATEIAIHRVLSAIDFSPSAVRALNHAIEIARSYGAKYYLAPRCFVDIAYPGRHGSFYFPIVTCIVLSLAPQC
jgi:nucleotide-binding universal stress UspA family protein